MYQDRTEYVEYLLNITSLRRTQFLLCSIAILFVFPCYSVMTGKLFIFASFSDTFFFLFIACGTVQVGAVL